MALRVWLPLNGDLTNQGLSGDAAVTSSNVAYAEGKIGKAASFTGNAAKWIHVGANTDFRYTDTFTYACWFDCYNLASSNLQMIVSNGRDYDKYGINMGINSAGSIRTIIGTSYHADAIGISTNTWYHYAVTYENGKCCIYINGSLIWSGAVGAVDYTESWGLTVGKMSYSYTSTGEDFPFNGMVNDVRVYDNCLSAREIKEISKGLVLHYPLSDKYALTTDKAVYDTSGFKYNGTISGSPEWNDDTPRYKGSYKFTSSTPYIYTNNTLPPLRYFTFAIWGKGAANESMPWGYSSAANSINLYFSEDGYLYWNTGDSNANPFSNNGTQVAFPTDGAWHHYVVTGDGATATLYVDGVKKGTAKTYKYPTRGNVTLSSWAYDRNYPWLGSLSDFRVYSTALSEDEVKELYQLGAALTDNATLMSYEYAEDGTVALNTNGEFSAGTIVENEDTDTASISADTITAGNYIEW